MRSRRESPHLLATCFALLVVTTALAKDQIDETRTLAGTPQTSTERFTFVVEKDGPYPHYDLAIQMTRGHADLRILDPTGRLLESMGAQACTMSAPIRNARTPGAYTVEITTTDAIGQWHIRVYGGPAPPQAPLGPGMASAGSMMLIALASVWFWRRQSGAAWRWFWVGAAVWTVAVAVKFAIAIPLNDPISHALQTSLPHWAYLTTGTIYGGLLTGITEILFTFIAALIWRQFAATAARGVAIGVGAGAFEAALVAIGVAMAAIMTHEGAATWSIAFAPAAERLIVILCHTASRALVLLSVARRQWALFWYGFLLLSAIDSVATVFYLTGQINKMSPWTMEALLAPFALASIPIIIWCIRHWPSPPPAQTPALSA